MCLLCIFGMNPGYIFSSVQQETSDEQHILHRNGECMILWTGCVHNQDYV